MSELERKKCEKSCCFHYKTRIKKGLKTYSSGEYHKPPILITQIEENIVKDKYFLLPAKCYQNPFRGLQRKRRKYVSQ